MQLQIVQHEDVIEELMRYIREHDQKDEEQDRQIADLYQRTQEILETQRAIYDVQRQIADELEQVRRRRPVPLWQILVVLTLALTGVFVVLTIVLHII